MCLIKQPSFDFRFQMAEHFLKCILFDQDAFRDIRMVAADFRQQHWDKAYLPELLETSKSELLYIRSKPKHFQLKPITDINTVEGYILRHNIVLDKVVLLGSNQDGLYLEKAFDEALSDTGYYSVPDNVGNLRTGIRTKINDTDLDIVFEFHGVHITDNPSLSADEPYLTVEYSHYPGYVRLRIRGNPYENVNESPYLIPKNLKNKLSNVLTRCQFFVKHGESSGPAFQGNLEDEFGVFDIDYVACLTMKEWPSVAESFIHRERLSGWPTPDIVAEVVSTGCGFVAVGHRKSETSHTEWRISFSAAEKMLIRKLTNEQVRAYLFYKSIFKTHLREPEGLSSYMMKNILLWTIELIPYESWRADNIFGCVEAMVDLLAAYLYRRIIPNYFVVKRNMVGHIDENVLSLLYTKVLEIQTDVLTAILSCIDNKEFAGMYNVPFYLVKDKFNFNTENAKILLSMAYFTMYLNVRIQVYRYICALDFRIFKECENCACRSLFAVVTPKAVWYLIEALKTLPSNSVDALRLQQSQDQFVLDISGFRTEVVAFIKSDMYRGILSRVLDDQEFITNETIFSIPEFGEFIDWVDMTLTWQGGPGVNPGNFTAAVELD